MSALLRLAVAFLMALVVLGAAPGTSRAAPDSLAHHYTYDSAATSSTLPHADTERGPPITCDHVATPVVVDLPSRGLSACLKKAALDAHNAHNSPVLLAQVGMGRATTPESFRPIDGDLSAVKRWRVAAKSADEVADIGHAGLRHQFPNTLKGKSQFYDNVDLGGLASRTKGMDGFLQTNGNTRYVVRNPGGVGVDRTTGLPTDVFTVIRRPDGSVVTMFPGTSPKG